MKPDLKEIDEYTETIIKSKAPDLKIPPEACVVDGEIEPCGIVIFGATGDLTSRKLAPALYDLFLSGGLPEHFFILGAARSELDDDKFRERIRNALAGSDLSRWDEFGRRLHYQRLHYDSLDSFRALARRLESVDKDHGTAWDTIFYLAIPPSLYEITARMLEKSGLSDERDGGRGWSRIVVEKPFGNDLETAIELNDALHQGFSEQQIFRIDHYLAKETVQNVMILRFANTIFEPLWNRMYVDRVYIRAIESLGVERRAAYYEEAGVLRDMFQNHMLQLLALSAMEPPARFEADPVRDEKVKVFHCLRPFDTDNSRENLVLGQYARGVINGEVMPGYRETSGVSPDSVTPTFATMRVFLDNWRWQGVPFFMTSGKALAEKRTEIVIHFKQVPHSMFKGTFGEAIHPNKLILGIYPDEKIDMTFQTKNPGAKVCLRSVTMDFNYLHNYTGPTLDAYQKVLLDCLLGDQMLFWRQDAVEQAWAFFTPLLQECETCSDRSSRLAFYPAGGSGPEPPRQWGM